MRSENMVEGHRFVEGVMARSGHALGYFTPHANKMGMTMRNDMAPMTRELRNFLIHRSRGMDRLSQLNTANGMETGPMRYMNESMMGDAYATFRHVQLYGPDSQVPEAVAAARAVNTAAGGPITEYSSPAIHEAAQQARQLHAEGRLEGMSGERFFTLSREIADRVQPSGAQAKALHDGLRGPAMGGLGGRLDNVASKAGEYGRRFTEEARKGFAGMADGGFLSRALKGMQLAKNALLPNNGAGKSLENPHETLSSTRSMADAPKHAGSLEQASPKLRSVKAPQPIAKKPTFGRKKIED